MLLQACPRAKSAKKLEPSNDSNFNTLGLASYALQHLHSLSGEKGNTLVSQKRMQKYNKFFKRANILVKNLHFLYFLPDLCQANVTNRHRLERCAGIIVEYTHSEEVVVLRLQERSLRFGEGCLSRSVLVGG